MITARTILLGGLVLIGLSCNGFSQVSDDAKNAFSAAAVTADDPFIPTDQLAILVKPMTKDELRTEAQAWFGLLREKGDQIARARLGVKAVNEAVNEAVSEVEAAAEQAAAENEATVDDSTVEPPAADTTAASPGNQADVAVEAEVAKQVEKKEILLESVNELQDERTALSDRLEVVLTSLEKKGGDVEEYRMYVAAVSGIELDTSDAQAAWRGFIGWLTSKEGGQRWGWNLAKFVTILLVTSIIAKFVAKMINWLLDRKVRLSRLAERLIANSIKNVVFVIGLAVALTALEIDITPIVAAIGATGLVVGLALQGTLSNFASGLMILVNRPFDVGNVVCAGGITGTVDKMNLVSTTFRTFDNQTIHVPNNEIWNKVITNITANENRRVDMEFGISYENDFEQAEKIILQVVNEHDLVLNDPEPVVVTHELADSSVKIVCRPWAKTSDWWKVKTDVTRAVKRQFDSAGISIPYPQTDVHVHQK
ncbi:MAG: mechanosensitive ion channel family protein [Planctomycetales bacterium]|nr:mechanosensitive ion channel family protein [Planctomycetales bacterium]